MRHKVVLKPYGIRPMHAISRYVSSSIIGFTLAGAAACSTEKAGSDTASADTAAPPSMAASSAGTGMNMTNGDMSSMKNMTGDPDRDFLRMMSDHHKGLIAMAHPTIESKEALSVKADAKKLDAKQDSEIEKMVSMLSKEWKDDYTPSVTPSNQKMVDELKGKSGDDYSRTFLKNVVMHHEQAVSMINEYLPKGKNAEVKKMAEKMKVDQQREITEFNRKIAKLGG